MSEIDWPTLVAAAESVRANAHAPYSHYKVGAAILTDLGVVTGCNVENAAYPLSICAEAAAVVHAVSRGARVFHAVAVATQGPEAGAPCGGCRQILSEFAPRLPVGLSVLGTLRQTVTLDQLLPMAFTPKVLDDSTRK